MNVVLPLFPTYLFVHIDARERVKVLESPGVLQIIGNSREHVTISDSEIGFLRSGFWGQRIEPFRELVIGEKVRIKSVSRRVFKGRLLERAAASGSYCHWS